MKQRVHFKLESVKSSGTISERDILKQVQKNPKIISEALDSRAIIAAAKLNNIDLQMIESLDELMTNTNIKLDKYYLLSIGNSTTLTTDGSVERNGHFILTKLSQKSFKRKKFLICFYFTSQNLSKKAVEDFKEFSKTYNIPCIPEVQHSIQPVMSFINEPNSLCGAYALSYLKNKGKINEFMPLDKLDTSKMESTHIKNDSKVPNFKKKHNDVTLLKKKVVKDAIRLNKKY